GKDSRKPGASQPLGRSHECRLPFDRASARAKGKFLTASVRSSPRMLTLLGWRQEVDVVQGGQARDLLRVGHVVDLLEQVEQLARGRHPEQALDRLVGLVE